MIKHQLLKLLKVAIVGSPNAGKSTLLNRLVTNDISCVSNKVHTTRKNTLGVLTEFDTQLVFYDSPGVVTPEHVKKHRLDHNMLTDPVEATHKCDLITVVIDASNIREQKVPNKGIRKILKEHSDKLSFLVLNKVDKIKDKRILLDLSRIHNDNGEHKKFDQIFSISALKDDGIDELRSAMIDMAKPIDEWPHGPDYLTNQNTQDIVNNIIRGKVMDILENAVPYLLKYKYDYCKFDEMGNLHVQLTLNCPEKYMVSKVIGERGVNVFRITEDSRDLISKTLGCDVKLSINVYSKGSNYN